MKVNITIAIPSYNKEKEIERCLKSILKNKDYVDKIILVDNNSTDKTLEIAKKYKSSITCIKNDTNLGMSGNWNKCIDLCDTEWLMIFHADDEIEQDVIPYYIRAIEKYPTAGIIHANAYSIDGGDFSTKTEHKINQKEFWKAGIDAMNCKPSVCSAVMVKKEAYKELGYFIDKSLSSDVEMWHRISSKYDTVFIKHPTVIYHTSKESTGQMSLINRSVREIKEDWDLLTEKMASHYPDEISRDKFIKESTRSAPGSYFAVTKANIRAKNYKNVFDSLIIIIFTYNGFFPLISMVFKIIKKRLLLIFKKM